MALLPTGNAGTDQGIWSAIKSGVVAINNLGQIISRIFPLASSSVTTTANPGVETLPANPTGFLTIEVDGVPYKVPLYEP